MNLESAEATQPGLVLCAFLYTGDCNHPSLTVHLRRVLDCAGFANLGSAFPFLSIDRPSCPKSCDVGHVMSTIVGLLIPRILNKNPERT